LRVERAPSPAAFEVDFDFVERECRAFFSGFRFAFVSLENKYFGRWLVGKDFFGFCVYWSVLGVPPSFPVFWNEYFSGHSRQVFGE
jgi:hypothetical protein